MRFAMVMRLVAVFSLLVAGSAAAQSPVQKIQLVPADTLASLSWQTLAADPQGDGLHPHLPDARELALALDAKGEIVWFRVRMYEALPENWFGINVAIDSDDKPDNGMPWWGTNKANFDRLASAYLFKGDGYWQGVAGVTDSDGAKRAIFNNLSRDVKVSVDREQRTIMLGVPRAALGSSPTVRVIATVGSTLVNNDDVPNEGMATVKLTP
jgi:hypothetical protein